MIKSCKKCAHWYCLVDDYQTGFEVYGECRRHPPTKKVNSDYFAQNPDIDDKSQWEIVTHWEDYCGEWEQSR